MVRTLFLSFPAIYFSTSSVTIAAVVTIIQTVGIPDTALIIRNFIQFEINDSMKI